MLLNVYSLLLSQILNYKNTLVSRMNLPTLTEVFPEIKNLWPIWVKKNGFKIKCNKDSDCLFPQACCHHPIIPGDNFCCYGGYKARELEYAFAIERIK